MLEQRRNCTRTFGDDFSQSVRFGAVRSTKYKRPELFGITVGQEPRAGEVTRVANPRFSHFGEILDQLVQFIISDQRASRDENRCDQSKKCTKHSVTLTYCPTNAENHRAATDSPATESDDVRRSVCILLFKKAAARRSLERV